MYRLKGSASPFSLNPASERLWLSHAFGVMEGGKEKEVKCYGGKEKLRNLGFARKYLEYIRHKLVGWFVRND